LCTSLSLSLHLYYSRYWLVCQYLFFFLQGPFPCPYSTAWRALRKYRPLTLSIISDRPENYNSQNAQILGENFVQFFRTKYLTKMLGHGIMEIPAGRDVSGRLPSFRNKKRTGTSPRIVFKLFFYSIHHSGFLEWSRVPSALKNQ
jgi:hypothetical protein